MSGLFISYRHEDSSADAGRLFDELQRRCANGQVFMDLQIPAGANFRDVIAAKLDSCVAVLVLIGPDWLNQRDPKSGQPRLHDENDFVRFELATALEKNKVVIPVLLPGAALPAEQDLPVDVKSLVRRQAMDIRYQHWATDVNELVAQLPPTFKRRREPAIALAGNRWVYLLLLPVLLMATIMNFAAPTVPVRPEFIAFGLAVSAGAAHAWLFRPSAAWKVLLATFISLASVVAMSALVWATEGDPILPRTPGEVRLWGIFVIAIFSGYLFGGVCVDVLTSRARAP
jgi:hypothetical protein